MKKNTWLLIGASLFFSCNKILDYLPHPHDPLTEFNAVFGGTGRDEARSLAESRDGGYLIAGSTSSNDGDVSGNHGGLDAGVMKLDKSGAKLWQRSLGGSKNDYAYAVVASPDGGCMVAGTTTSTDGDVSGNHGEADAWVVKLDKYGNLQWQKTFGGSKDDAASSLTKSLDGGYVLVGSTSSTDGDVSGGHGSPDAWVVKLDNAGNLLWQKTLGGSGYDVMHAVAISLDGGYIMSGFSTSNDGDVSGNHGKGDVWMVKLDNEGALEWQRSLGGSGDDAGSAVAKSLDGGYIVACYIISTDGDITGNHGGADAWVVKLDKNGDMQWQKALGGTNADEPRAILQTKDGGYLMSGTTGSRDGDATGHHGYVDAWVVKLSSDGSKKWHKLLGGSDEDYGNSIITRPDGSYVMAITTHSNDGDVSGNHGSSDVWALTLKDE